MKEMVAVPAVPTAELMVNADAASAVTAPTAGTLTYAATVSLLVSIFKPVLVVTAVNAGVAERVRPVHVTVTGPAGSRDAACRVITSVRATCM